MADCVVTKERVRVVRYLEEADGDAIERKDEAQRRLFVAKVVLCQRVCVRGDTSSYHRQKREP